tara:strand:+ start:98 stop:439 length:342 start_codon:yes stop_codon:yes gene_type:complete
MSRLEIILAAILAISIVLNVGVFVYARAAIIRLLSVSEELGDLSQMTNAFASHLQAVYELDTFYGDETLNALLQHAISFNEQLDTFEYIYSLTEEESSIDDRTVEEEEDTQEA